MHWNAAGASLANGVERIIPACRAVRLVFNVVVVAKQVCVRGDGLRRLTMIQCPDCFGSVNILAVYGAGLLLRLRDSVFDAWNGNGRQKAYNGHDDHDFDQCETRRG